MSSQFRVIVAFVLALLCVLATTGCSGGSSDVAGVYELDKEAVKAAAQAEAEKSKDSEDGMAAMGAAMMIGMIDQMSMTLTLNADGSAHIVTNAMGQSDTAKGTWKMDGKTISVSAANEGEEMKTVNGTVSGDTISMKPEGDDEMPFDLVFKRKK